MPGRPFEPGDPEYRKAGAVGRSNQIWIGLVCCPSIAGLALANGRGNQSLGEIRHVRKARLDISASLAIGTKLNRAHAGPAAKNLQKHRELCP
jgi:hypothetical protein